MVPLKSQDLTLLTHGLLACQTCREAAPIHACGGAAKARGWIALIALAGLGAQTRIRSALPGQGGDGTTTFLYTAIACWT